MNLMILKILLKILGVRFDLSSLIDEYGILEKEMTKEGFWNDSEKAQIIVKKAKLIEKKIKKIKDIETEFEDIRVLSSIAIEEDDAELFVEIFELLKM